MGNMPDWFSHDTPANADRKSIKLIDETTPEGYGIFWILNELMAMDDNCCLPLTIIPAVARRYNTNEDLVRSVVYDYDLYVIEKDVFYSESLKKRLSNYKAKRKKMSIGGKKGMAKRYGSVRARQEKTDVPKNEKNELLTAYQQLPTVHNFEIAQLMHSSILHTHRGIKPPVHNSLEKQEDTTKRRVYKVVISTLENIEKKVCTTYAQHFFQKKWQKNIVFKPLDYNGLNLPKVVIRWLYLPYAIRVYYIYIYIYLVCKNEKNPEKILSEKTKILAKEIQFNDFWKLYDKKIGNKEKIRNKFIKLKDDDIKLIFETLPLYIKATPNKKFRKNPETYLNNFSWRDEIILDNGFKDNKQEGKNPYSRMEGIL